MLNSLIYRFFTLCFIASTFLDVSVMGGLAFADFEKDLSIGIQSLAILLASIAIPLYLLWRNIVTLPSDRALLPASSSPSQAWAMGLTMLFVWAGSLLSLAWLISTTALAAGVESPLIVDLGGAYLTGTLKTIAVPIIFAVELQAARR
jgi:hypothetical protein